MSTTTPTRTDHSAPALPLTWRPTNAPVASSRTDDIWFRTPELGWAVNSNGQIVHTADGGDSWEEQFHETNVYFRCVGFASDSRGWVGTLTPTKRMFDTTDGGATWNPVVNLPPQAPVAICGLAVVDESVVYAAGTNFPNQPTRMMKTLDGGATWTAWDMSAHATLLVDTYFSDAEHGWVVGGKAQIANPTRDDVKAVVLHTDDGGQTWVNRAADLEAELPLGEWGWKIQFLDDQVGFVSLESFDRGAILKTTDGGQSWKRLEINDPQRNANLEGVGFVDADHGWVGGWGDPDFEGGFSSETHDGGQNWRNANEIGKFINRFRFFGNPVTVGYASGLTVYKYSVEPVPIPLREVAPATRFLENNEPTDAARPLRIPVTIPDGAEHLAIDIWGRFGDHVRQLLDDSRPTPGTRIVEWDVTDDAGEPLANGSFIVRITVDGESESQIVHIRGS
ncbi:MAG TPA: YCF48-related protein [Pseudonocardiaceae bacterium]